MKRARLRFRKGFRVALSSAAGALVLIEHGDEHEIVNSGRGLLRTLNLYVLPAHTRDGDELPRGKP